MKSVYQLEIPEVHPSLNKWVQMNRFARARLRDECKETIWACAKNAKIPMIKTPVEIEIVYHHKFKKENKVRLDIDNFTPKFYMDGLSGIVIPDDSIDYVKKLTWTVIKDGENRSVILIKPIKE